MNAREEKIYTKDNVRRWAHCLLRNIKTSSKIPKIDNYHYHDYIELLYFISGEGRVCVNDTAYDVSVGDMVIINPQQAHYTSFKTDAVFYCIKFLPGLLYDSDQPLWDLKYVLPFISEGQDYYFLSENATRNTGIEALLEEIMREWTGEQYAYELVIRANILKIMSITFRICRSKGIELNGREIPEIVKKAVTYTVDNYSTVTMQEAAAACGLSYNYFSHAFHEALGVSFCNYLTTVKVNAAERMLMSSEKSITDIAVDTGFSSTSHFISCFKKVKGITPARFRKETTTPEK